MRACDGALPHSSHLSEAVRYAVGRRHPEHSPRFLADTRLTMATERLGSCRGKNGSFFDAFARANGSRGGVPGGLWCWARPAGQRALVTNAETSGRHSSGENLNLRRAAA